MSKFAFKKTEDKLAVRLGPCLGIWLVVLTCVLVSCCIVLQCKPLFNQSFYYPSLAAHFDCFFDLFLTTKRLRELGLESEELTCEQHFSCQLTRPVIEIEVIWEHFFAVETQVNPECHESIIRIITDDLCPVHYLCLKLQQAVAGIKHKQTDLT